LPPLYARPRHAAPRDHSKVRAALVPAVLLASTGSALGGLAVSASAEEPAAAAVVAASAVPVVEAEAMLAERLELIEERASREREAEQAAAAAVAEAARVEAERVVAEQAAAAAAAAAAPKYVRPGVGRLTSGFGNRWGRLHAGIDLASGVGSPVRAAATGTVVSAQNEGGYGKCVRIKHSDGTVTVYAHLSSFLVGRGEKVGAGEQIAREGNTGQSTGPHLHFEVRVGGTPVNPRAWLAKRGVGV